MILQVLLVKISYIWKVLVTSMLRVKSRTEKLYLPPGDRYLRKALRPESSWDKKGWEMRMVRQNQIGSRSACPYLRTRESRVAHYVANAYETAPFKTKVPGNNRNATGWIPALSSLHSWQRVFRCCTRVISAISAEAFTFWRKQTFYLW